MCSWGAWYGLGVWLGGDVVDAWGGGSVSVERNGGGRALADGWLGQVVSVGAQAWGVGAKD